MGTKKYLDFEILKNYNDKSLNKGKYTNKTDIFAMAVVFF